ncbi:Protein MEMO1 [Porphyridium purpureum]|uniref:Protein MEMO1 n=1 Tax=Porphyridium purpureum TaxID=35688 RepID=A0A5J4YKC3_PORPP|nr:Protein MEMO1 [Porphyridium purpureum]|eukprot:POR5521..scf297_16
MVTRRASHAGSWYTDDTSALRADLARWLQDAASASASAVPNASNLVALIVPHAGYSYSGPTAAFAYGAIRPEAVKRVIILGPSHHVHTTKCMLTRAQTLDTPLGKLQCDAEFVAGLHAQHAGLFEYMDAETDEDEHSIEMQLPYLAQVFGGVHTVKVVEIMVGSLSFEQEQQYGRVLAPYIADGSTLFVISSDFCHWGRRFRYVRYEAEHGEIWQSIEKLDHEGIACIRSLDHAQFHAYLGKTKNTICGRHPIGVFLGALEASAVHSRTRFELAQYAQSSRARAQSDSSVSYVAAHFITPE